MKKSNNLIALFLVVLLLILFSIEIILCLTPPIARDALIHHLAIPKLWLQHGGFYDIKWAIYSYYPMNIDLLYLLPLYFQNDIIPNFIHMGFGVATAFLIFIYLYRRLGMVAGILGAVIFLSTPIVVRLSTVAYVDLGLVFFTTASLLALIHWRDGNYREYKWLILCSIAMGLALGTKYNALIAWFYLSLAIVFIISRDTGEQWKGIRYGIIFFLISLLVFSPWLIKNLILTGNPLYPLFKGIFSASNSNDGGALSIVTGETSMGIFKVRELLYGESFWDTLMIPVRFFFQGQDHSDRFFDGVLNPILLIMVPFAFMNKSRRHDKLLFLCFAIFYILLAFFLNQLRVRYILPSVPVLCILATIGLINLFNWIQARSNVLRNFLVIVVSALFILVMSKNIFYINNYFQSISPVNYIFHKETRDEFIQRHVKSYSAISYINKNTAPQSKIILILLAGRGYYLDRPYEEDSSFGMNIIHNLVDCSKNDKSFQTCLDSLNCTHLLINTNLLHQFLKNNYSQDAVDRLSQRMAETMEVIFTADGFTVYKIVVN